MGNADDDDTIRQLPGRQLPGWQLPGWQQFQADHIEPPAAPAKPRRLTRFWLPVLVVGTAASAIVAAGLAFLPGQPTPQPVAAAPILVLPRPVSRAAIAKPTLASEAEIIDTRSSALTIFRLAGNPSILVFDFPTLHEQAQMLNRVAVMIETAGQPRDHVLDDAELDRAVRATGMEPDSFYDGHDYRAADIIRFFRAAAQDGTRLNPNEVRLHDILQAAGWFDSGNSRPGALISIPTMGVGVDADARAVVLRHEMSHGEYFTNPAYNEHVNRFWQNELTATERSGFRHFLTAQHYDSGNEDLMMNETQAYLVHTADPRFFTPPLAGLTVERGRQLREHFIATMPAGWLRDLTTRPPAAGSR